MERRAEVSYRLQSGDVLRIPPIAHRQHRTGSNRRRRRIQGAELPIVYEDEGLLVVDKPAGIAVHGGSGVSFGVIEALRRQRPQARFLELAHRLDRETSGILLLGKKRSVLTGPARHVSEGGLGGSGRGADKRYLVLVCGRWMDPLRNVEAALAQVSAGVG
jgi:23S rRNA pseudouridine955/2504/2580 synthase